MIDFVRIKGTTVVGRIIDMANIEGFCGPFTRYMLLISPPRSIVSASAKIIGVRMKDNKHYVICVDKKYIEPLSPVEELVYSYD